MTVTPDVQMTFSVAAQPGVYALLLGSGISKGAGVPTGWEVAEDLARRLADQQDEDPGDDPIGWYKSWCGENPDYPSLVEALAPSPADRRNLLRSYFEATSDDEGSPAPVPSSAHRSIASLVAQGLVSVIVTTNFDRLLERAIADAGKEPVVIATPDAARGAEPFAHTDITIIKVNGDYLSPNLKNTVDELSSYDEDTDRVLDQVFDEYGLIVCGWSADWDTALRAALCHARSRRYSTYWMHRDPLGEHATRLVARARAIAVPIDDADGAFGALADGVAALRAARDRHPPTTDLAVGRLKLYLPDPLNRIKLHDLLESETEAVIKHLAEGEAPVQESPTADEQSMWFNEKLAFYESATARLLRLLAVGARFSDSAHQHDLWAHCVDRLAVTTGDVVPGLRGLGGPRWGEPSGRCCGQLTAHGSQGGLMAQIRQHRNAKLTVRQRREMVSVILEEGWPVAAAAERFQVSAKTARKWRDRYLDEGADGLADRSSRPRRSPTRTPEATRRRVIELRARRRGAAWIAHRVGLAPSTVQAILHEAGLGRLDVGDRATAKPQRYVRETPGELIHVDIKKLPGIPPGGGWRAHGRGRAPNPGAKAGYRYLHSALDDHSRLVYSEIHDDERGQTAADFWRRAERWFAAWGVHCERVLTDNGPCYRSRAWHRACKRTATKPKKTRPYRPQTNGKIERFHRTLLEEWAYIRPWTSETQRAHAYRGFLHYYNCHRTHSALNWNTPASTIGNNLPSQHT